MIQQALKVGEPAELRSEAGRTWLHAHGWGGPMTRAAARSPSDDGPLTAIARWENEGGAPFVPPAGLAVEIRRDLIEREKSQAAHTADLDAEGALRSFHSYPWAIPSTIVE